MSESLWQTVIVTAGPILAVCLAAVINHRQMREVKHAVNGTAAALAAKNAEETTRLHDKLDALEAKLARTQDKLADTKKG